MKQRDQNEIVTENEAAYMKYMMDIVVKDGKAESIGFKKKMPKFKTYSDRSTEDGKKAFYQ